VTTYDFQLWTLIGTWVASIGTISAVIASLYFAYNQNRINLKITVGHRQVVSGLTKNTPDFCIINVVNIGSKPAKIIGVGWRAGCFKNKVSFIQLFKTPGYDDVPKVLAEGEDATFWVPFNLNGDEKDWIHRFPKSVTEKSKRNLKSLKLWVHTSHGQTFTVKPERGLLQKLAESIKS
jgi:hypothetical protein